MSVASHPRPTLQRTRWLHAERWITSVLALLTVCSFAMVALSTWASEAIDPHAHHHHAIPEFKRSTASYQVPDVALVRDDGQKVQLRSELNDGRPVVLSFIYTTCTTVCPVTSQTLSQLQSRLGTAREAVHLMSISIDPEQDTPKRLHAYARQYGAGPEWQHYTGTLMASQTAQRAFDVYRGDKMSHAPATLIRLTPDSPWVRIDGFATADQLLSELASVVPPNRSGG